MTTEPKCLPGCLCVCKWEYQAGVHRVATGHGFEVASHAPGCPNAEAPKVEDWDDLCGCEPGTYCDNHKPAPATEPDPLTGIDAHKWAQEFMRIWSGRWSEVDEGLMIGWFANAIMRGYDEGRDRLRKELQSANPAPAPEAPKLERDCYCHCHACKMGCTCTEPGGCCKKCDRFLPAPEPKQGEEPIDQFEAYHRAMWLCERSDMSDAEINLARAHLALRAEVDRLAKLGTELALEKAALRAELAQAREEIAKLREACTVPDVTFNAERRARERADARVKELSEAASLALFSWRNDGFEGVQVQMEDLEAILARAKEGEKR